MTGEYTFVAPERQNELTRRIQRRLADASRKSEERPSVSGRPAPSTPEVPPGLADAEPATQLVQ
jgi:hypothetical protein